MSAVGIGLSIAGTAGAAALIGGGIYSATGAMGEDQRKAIEQGAGAQVAGTRQQEAAVQQGNEAVQAMLDPYAQQRANPALTQYQQSGMTADAQMRAFLGLSGPEAQQQAIAQIESSPAFAAMLQQGENAILQNASATGNLRGGNTQAALAQFRPALLNSLMEQQYAKLAGMQNYGQGASTNLLGTGLQATGTHASSRSNLAQQLAQIYGDRAAYQAGGIIGQQQAVQQGRQQAFDNTLGVLGTGIGIAKVASGVPG